MSEKVVVGRAGEQIRRNSAYGIAHDVCDGGCS